MEKKTVSRSRHILNFLPLGAILIVYFLFSFLTFRDYGITTDEPVEYTWGRELSEFWKRETKYTNAIEPVYEGESSHIRHTPLLSKYNRWYPALMSNFNGPGFYERAHFINMTFASLLFVSVYSLVYFQYKKATPAFLATLFTVLTPRILGHIPANPKDIPFAVMYFLSTALIIYTVTKVKNPLHKVLILSIPFALTQGIRVVGFTIYATFLIFEYLKNKKIAWDETLLLFAAANFFMMWTWPHVGANYIQNLYHVVIGTKTSYDYWAKEIFFMGNTIGVGNRPWYYLPTFLFLTLPLYVLIPNILNLKSPRSLMNNDVVKVSWIVLAINLGMYFVFDPIIYNGMRHFLYLLPFLSLIAGITVYEWFISGILSRYKTLILSLIIVNLISVVTALFQLHPYEYTYFNELIGGTKNAANYFEVDYWDASYKDAMAWFIENVAVDDDKTYYVSTCNMWASVEYYAKIAGKDIKPHTLQITDKPLQVHYEICDHFRTMQREYDLKDKKIEVIHIVKKNGVPLNYIRKHVAPARTK